MPPAATKYLSITGVTQTPKVLPAVPETIQYDFQIKAISPTKPVIAAKIKVQIFFFDQLPDGKRVPAIISAKFLSPTPFPQVGGTETLRIEYHSRDQKDFQKSTFCGYILRVYYNNILQDEKASPPELLTSAPPSPPFPVASGAASSRHISGDPEFRAKKASVP